ncbi:MAG: glycoside hydrolase family 127 protein [Saprospiraceae bacterium]
MWLGEIGKATASGNEIGLVKLYQVLRKTLSTSPSFSDVRGYRMPICKPPKSDRPTRNVGHVVRACAYAAMAGGRWRDVDQYMPALNAIWKDVVSTKMYITGGIGSSQ